jgi:prephenate dehydrogenase
MGGSLGLTLRRRGLAKVSAYARREETRRLALEMGASDTVHDTLKAALRGADLAVLCTPVCSMPQLVQECLGAFEPGCVVTDIGSTKADLISEMDRLFKTSKATFVGSHPMAGSEKTGVESARSDLYEGAVVAVTPSGGTPEADIQRVAALWAGVGARVVRLAPDLHDLLVAKTSHLPHLIAALLVATTGRQPLPDGVPLFCGPGFRDATRIAGGSPEMWRDIVKTNRTAILGELRHYEASLAELISLIETQDYDGVQNRLDEARLLRAALLGSQPKIQ